MTAERIDLQPFMGGRYEIRRNGFGQGLIASGEITDAKNDGANIWSFIADDRAGSPGNGYDVHLEGPEGKPVRTVAIPAQQQYGVSTGGAIESQRMGTMAEMLVQQMQHNDVFLHALVKNQVAINNIMTGQLERQAKEIERLRMENDALRMEIISLQGTPADDGKNERIDRLMGMASNLVQAMNAPALPAPPPKH